MNKATRAGLSIGIALATLGIITATAQAAGNKSNCQVIYGGGEVCPTSVEFTLDKLVQKPNKGGEFVDNIAMDDTRFHAGDTVLFRIRVTNTGSETIPTITVTDTLPNHVTYKSGATNANGQTITYTVENLTANETRENDITVTVNSNLPTDKSVSCLTNTATGRDNLGNEAKDNAAFCIETEVVGKKPTPQVHENVPVKKIPETGPEMLPLITLIPAGIAGIALRRKNKLG